MVRRALVLGALSAALLFSPGFACNNFEQTAYKSLAASKAAIDKAGEMYNANEITRTTCSRDLIRKGRDTQTVAVQAMMSYETIKATKNGDLGTAQTIATEDLTQLAGTVAGIEQWVADPTKCGHSK